MLLLFTTLCTALMAGLFFTWSCSIVPGLSRLPDKEYISAMQSINSAIQNPVFFLCFFGTALLLPLSAYTQTSYSSPAFYLLALACILYIGCVFGTTILANVPLNESLASLDIKTSSPEQMALQRAAFEVPWNKWNILRTFASIAALICLLLAYLRPDDVLSQHKF